MTGSESSQLKVFFGGSFDPVHRGHLGTAALLRELLLLPEIYLVPAARSPFKGSVTADVHRLAMLNLAIAGDKSLVVDTRELRRPSPSYTVDTLHELRQEYGDERPLAWVMGMDALIDIWRWAWWKELIQLAHLIVVARPGNVRPVSGEVGAWLSDRSRQQSLLDISSSSKDDAAHVINRLSSAPCGTVVMWSLHPLPYSSTAVRAALQRGECPDGLTENVWHYVREHNLYAENDNYT